MRLTTFLLALVAGAHATQVAEPAFVEQTLPGQSWPSPPAHLELGFGPDTRLEEARGHLLAGDHRRALAAAEAVSLHGAPRDRDPARMMAGLLHREAGRHNLASEAFSRVRGNDGPLARWAAWYEAEQDLHRGKAQVAVRECERYRARWPEGAHAGPCLALMARGQARTGQFAAARQSARLYDEEHDQRSIAETVEREIALWLASHQPAQAAPALLQLARHHQHPLTGRLVEAELQTLVDQGISGAVLPTDPGFLMDRAVSLRDARRKDEAWAAFTALKELAPDHPGIAGFVAAQSERFAWRTHRWDELAALHEAAYAEKPDAARALYALQALERGGRYTEAAVWARRGLTSHGGAREWQRKDEELGRTFLLAKAWPEAKERFDRLAGRGGTTGRRGQFYAALAAYLGGEAGEARDRLTRLIESGSSYTTEARYWRAKAAAGLGEGELAASDRAWLRETDRFGWYSVLLGSPDGPGMAPWRRDGTWQGPPPSPVPAVADLVLPREWAHALPSSSTVRAPNPAFALMSWPYAPVEPTPRVPAGLWEDASEHSPPPSALPGPLYSPERATKAMDKLQEALQTSWPELAGIRELARAGLYDLSGPAFSAFYEDYLDARRSGRDPRSWAARQVDLDVGDWRHLFTYCRDHHHTARFTHGLWNDLAEPELQVEAWRLGYPLAHDQLLWQQTHREGIDPFLVLGLMRQESTYNSVAVSRAGAMGAMQIMPRTGHLLADLARDRDFHTGDLEDPLLSIRYGVHYLGLLMQRFDGVYPLAVASYNGGPFSVSAWRRAVPDLPMDAFVELIPFRETRDYVKKVTAGYAAYSQLYGPAGAWVDVPRAAFGDHPEVVDF